MALTKSANKLGRWAFLIGVILAVVLGIFGPLSSTWVGLLVLIGLIVGLLNITESETNSFLMSGLALIIASVFGQSVLQQVSVLNNILDALLAVFVPSTIIVSIRHVFTLAKR